MENVFDDFYIVCLIMFVGGGKIRFLSEIKSFSLLKSRATTCLRVHPMSLIQKRGYKNHKEDPLYVPFATDAERELASIRFWVSKNTNLKEVNVNCRVLVYICDMIRSERIYPSGAFLSNAKSILMEDVPFHSIRIKIPLREKSVRYMEERTTTTNSFNLSNRINNIVGRGEVVIGKCTSTRGNLY